MTKVNCIRVISTGCYISNLLTACIDAVLNNLRTAIDSQAISVHNSITGSYAVQTFQVLSKTSFQVVCAIRYNADIVISSQFVYIRNATDYIHLFVKFLLDNSTCITAIFHAVIQCCNIMFVAILFFDNETSDVCTVNARFTVATFNGDAVSTIFTIQADRAVFTVDNNSRAVFTVNSDGAIFAVSALLTKH